MRTKQKIALSMFIFTLISKIEAPNRDWLGFCGISFSNCVEIVARPIMVGILTAFFSDNEASLKLPSVPEEKVHEVNSWLANLYAGCIDRRVQAEEETRLMSLQDPKNVLKKLAQALESAPTHTELPLRRAVKGRALSPEKTTGDQISETLNDIKHKFADSLPTNSEEAITAQGNLIQAITDLKNFVYKISSQDCVLSHRTSELLSETLESLKKTAKLMQHKNYKIDLQFTKGTNYIVRKMLKDLKDLEELEKRFEELKSNFARFNPTTDEKISTESKIDKALHQIVDQVIARLPEATTARNNVFEAIKDLSQMVSEILSSSQQFLHTDKPQFDTLLLEILEALKGIPSLIADKSIEVSMQINKGIQNISKHILEKLEALENRLSQISKEVERSSSSSSIFTPVKNTEEVTSIASPKTPESQDQVTNIWAYAGFKGDVSVLPQSSETESSNSDEEDSAPVKPNKAFLAMCSALSKADPQSLEAKSSYTEDLFTITTGRPSSASSSSTDLVASEVKPLVLTVAAASPKPTRSIIGWNKGVDGKWTLTKSENTHKTAAHSDSVETTPLMTVKERIKQADTSNEKGIYFYRDPNPTGRVSSWKKGADGKWGNEKSQNTPERAPVQITTQKECPLAANPFPVFHKPSLKGDTPTNKMEVLKAKLGLEGTVARQIRLLQEQGSNKPLTGTVKIVNPGNGKPIERKVIPAKWPKALASSAVKSGKAGA